MRHSRNGRREQGVPLHQQPGWLDRRRHRDGMAGRLSRREHGIQPVPSNLFVPPAREVVPHHRGGARRRRNIAVARRRTLHAEVRCARRTRAARCRRACNRPRDEAAWRRLRVPRHQSQAERAHQKALPQHFRYVRLARHRHHARADTRRACRSLHVRRRRCRSERCDRHSRPLCRRRSEFHRPARREPPGQQFAARVSRVRQSGRGPHSNATRLRPCRPRRFPTGTKAA